MKLILCIKKHQNQYIELAYDKCGILFTGNMGNEILE